MMSRGVATQEKFLPCKRTEGIRIFFVAGDACVSQIWAGGLFMANSTYTGDMPLSKWDFAVE